MADLTVPQVAQRLQVGERHVRNLLVHGPLTGRQLPSGEWLVDSDAVTRYEVRRKPAGRGLDATTAWAALFELSGINTAELLPSATYTRLRKRLRNAGVEALALDVSGRTRTTRYRSANPTKAQADLVATGRAAAEYLASDLLADERRVAGYVPAGTSVADYARSHFMVEDPAGPDVLYENTAPGGLTRVLPAVVAADLAVSTDARERSAGLNVLESLRSAWR